MIIPERMSVYINSLDVGNGAFLDELEQDDDYLVNEINVELFESAASHASAEADP